MLAIKNAVDVHGNKIEVLIKDDKIIKVLPNIEDNCDNIIDASGLVLMPGIIDLHVHFRDPGATQKEDFLTGSMASAKGGITTIMDMPNTIPNTTTYDLLMQKKEIAKKSIVNYGLHFGSTKDGNIDEIKKVLSEKQAKSIKVFMNLSTGKMLVEDKNILEDIFKTAPLVFAHAEKEKITEAINLSNKYGTKVYFCHIPSAQEFDEINKAKEKNKNLYIEVSPNHLFLSQEDRTEDDMLLRLKPELKSLSDCKHLLNALKNNLVDTIGTDHAPHLLSEKEQKLTFGLPGVETSLALMLSLCNENKLQLWQIQKLMCENPAKIVGIKNRGMIKEGYYADLILIDPNKKWTFNKNEIVSKCGWSPYEGKSLTGKNITTIINGKIVYQNNEFKDLKSGREIEYE